MLPTACLGHWAELGKKAVPGSRFAFPWATQARPPLAQGWDCSVLSFVSQRHQQELAESSRQGRRGAGSTQQCLMLLRHSWHVQNAAPGLQPCSATGLKLQ